MKNINIIMSLLTIILISVGLSSTSAWADTGSTAVTGGLDATTLTVAVVIFAAPIVVIAYVFLFRWSRDVMAEWSKDRQLESITHAQTISSLSQIANGGQSDTAISAESGLKKVASEAASAT